MLPLRHRHPFFPGRHVVAWPPDSGRAGHGLTSNGGAWDAYAIESDAGYALAAFVECLSLPDTPGVLVFTLITLEDSFNDAYIAAIEVLDSIELHGTTSLPGDQQTGPRASPDYNNDEIGERA